MGDGDVGCVENGGRGCWWHGDAVLMVWALCTVDGVNV